MRVSIDISADQIAIYTPEERIFLERNGVDTTIWPTLVQLDQQSDFSEILLINGPGGFTNLRVGTLAINLLKMLKKSPLQLYSISKIELYQKFFTAEYLPRYGIIYIGQKANLWLRDFLDNQLIQKIKKSELDEYLTQYSEIFFDQVFDPEYFAEYQQLQISYHFDEQALHLSFQGKESQLAWEELAVSPLEQVEANYMIDPNIG